MSDEAETDAATAMVDENGGAGERERSTIGFPYMNLADAMEMAKALHENVGVGECSEDQLAAWMNLSPRSSGFRVRTATTKMFGLLESPSPGQFTLSPLGRAAVDPTRSAKAKVEAFLSVPLYRLVYDNYKGGVVPPPAAVERDIKSWGVAAKQTARARQALERSAEEAGFFANGRNRLVIPAVANYKGAEVVVGDLVPVKPLGEMVALPPDVDPIIRGLIARLPPSGSIWPSNERELWLNILKSSFQLVYKDSESTAN
ncbi:winged helix-turn-helix domain-containing protein [Mesorhizobium sp. ESP6-5]|uniref:winged helix-turn-helix domain-containing protein n=1 Tax=Mesorhizobium sp. ESP6-5 TaxID=2876623 RepID=UPI001CCEFA7D|nr:winged helix-turn-helix domain-containing protein [Mesorhizobium sp. ESP6-5]MBZ9754032.1 winged helix-turn-helix domain-containing protein [Mesorhizobium sp. ESP6-5]